MQAKELRALNMVTAERRIIDVLLTIPRGARAKKPSRTPRRRRSRAAKTSAATATRLRRIATAARR